MLATLRHGFKCLGKTLRIAFFRPAHGLNPELEARYQVNRLGLTRQLHFSPKNEKSLDVVSSVNGLPVVRYKQEFDLYIDEKGYPIKSLVAFSGIVEDDKLPEKTYTEVAMNDGVKEKELPDTFVLDFVNDPAEIQEAFCQYYEGSISLSEGYAKPLDGPREVGTGEVREEYVTLSRLVNFFSIKSPKRQVGMNRCRKPQGSIPSINFSSFSGRFWNRCLLSVWILMKGSSPII